MKIIALILILNITSLLYAQSINFISQKDFVTNINNQIKCEKIIKTESGENEMVSTKLFIGKSKATKTDIKFLNNMIDTSLINAKINLKNKSSFKAISLNIYELEDKTWMSYIKFSGTNDFGGRKDSELSIKFDDQLNILETFSMK